MTSNIAKNGKKSIIADLCNTLDKKLENIKEESGEGLPYGYLTKHIDSIRVVCPSITRHDVNNEFRRRAKRGNKLISAAIEPATTVENQVLTVATETALVHHNNLPRKTGGRPIGSTCAQKKIEEEALATVKNEIGVILQDEKKAAGKKNLKRGRLSVIIQETKERHGVPDDVVISIDMIRQRQKRRVECSQVRGLKSPLLSIEPQLIKILIQMAEIRQCLTPSEALHRRRCS